MDRLVNNTNDLGRTGGWVDIGKHFGPGKGLGHYTCKNQWSSKKGSKMYFVWRTETKVGENHKSWSNEHASNTKQATKNSIGISEST